MKPYSDPGHVLVGRGLTKSYGGTVALHEVDIALTAGERHAVTGENGAGKSTLIKLLGGIVGPDRGVVFGASGQIISSAAQARAAGVAIVHQHLSLVPTMSVEENCVLTGFPSRWGIVDRRAVRRAALDVMDRMGLDLDPARAVGELSFAERQLLEIGRGLLVQPRVMILDEPTSALTPAESDRLFEFLIDLSDHHDTAILYVSHRIGEIYALATRATVLRDGIVVDRLELTEHEPSDLVASMVGREIDLVTRREPKQSPDLGPPVLSVRGLRGNGIRGVDLDVHAGEICALAGLVGAGRTEFVRQVYGIDVRAAGTVKVGGRGIPPGRPGASLAAGVGFVPEDRHRDGIALALSSADNAIAPNLDRVYPRGLLRPRRVSEITDAVLVGGDVRPPDPSRITSSLSGGNQQKIVIGKWLCRDLRLLILDEPTAGVDVEAKNQIHSRIGQLADAGLAVLLVSSDLPEVLTLADRIVVMRGGEIVGELLPGDDWTEHKVIAIATAEEDQHVIEVV